MLQLDKIAAISFATCAFAKIGVSSSGVVRLRSNRDDIMFFYRLTNLADAIASIVLTQMALLGIEGPVDETGIVASAAFGIAMGGLIVLYGVWMLVHVARMRRIEGAGAGDEPLPADIEGAPVEGEPDKR